MSRRPTRPGAVSEAQLDLAAGVRARAEGATTADTGAQVLARLRLAARDPTVGPAPVQTVRPSCDLSLEVMRECRRAGRPFPDPHKWKDGPGELAGRWLRCDRCGEWTRKEDKTP